jgi:mono/diheme cytochrome c family protein
VGRPESAKPKFLARFSPCLCISVVSLFFLLGCEAELRKSDAELGLNPQQAAGRRLYDQHCARCHEPYSLHKKNGPSLQGVLKKQYMPTTGLPANDERTTELILYGRAKMPGFGRVLTQQQLADLLAYLHTL